MRGALLGTLAAGALLAACATPPERLPTAPTGGTVTEPAGSGLPEPSVRPETAAPAAAATTERAPGAAEPHVDPGPDPTPEPVPTGNYFDESGGGGAFAGLRVGAGGETVFLSVSSTTERDQGEGRFVVSEEVRSGADAASLGAPRKSRHEVAVTADALLISLVADRSHARPDPVVELPLPPVAGARWQVRNRFVAVDCEVLRIEPATTFEGAVPHCVLIELRAADGARVTRRWYHPQRGLVRSESRDARGRLTYGIARCGKSLPGADEIRALFGAPQ